jgi:hypothetical protein
VRRGLQDRATLEADLPLAESIEARQAVEHRRLACPVGADEADDVAARDVEGNAFEGRDAAEADGDVLDLKKRWIDGVTPGTSRDARTIGRADRKETGLALVGDLGRALGSA